MSMTRKSSPRQCLQLYQKAPPSYLCPLYRHHNQAPHSRALHTTSVVNAEYVPQQPRYPPEKPRWQQTPPRMKAPFRSKPTVEGNDFPVNEDPMKLDRVYEKVLGDGGDEMLTDEVKWLAVTHKSFDHGRRGYNDRLSFLGRRIVEVQTSIALINNSAARATPLKESGDSQGQPHSHPALQGLEGLTSQAKLKALEQQQIAKLGERYGLDSVIRWKPKRASSLRESGLALVIQQALYAIVGAVALHRGGQVANEVVRERILSPLGLYQGP